MCDVGVIEIFGLMTGVIEHLAAAFVVMRAPRAGRRAGSRGADSLGVLSDAAASELEARRAGPAAHPKDDAAYAGCGRLSGRGAHAPRPRVRPRLPQRGRPHDRDAGLQRPDRGGISRQWRPGRRHVRRRHPAAADDDRRQDGTPRAQPVGLLRRRRPLHDLRLRRWGTPAPRLVLQPHGATPRSRSRSAPTRSAHVPSSSPATSAIASTPPRPPAHRSSPSISSTRPGRSRSSRSSAVGLPHPLPTQPVGRGAPLLGQFGTFERCRSSPASSSAARSSALSRR